MHDPFTVAFDINYPWPWPRQKPWPGNDKPPRPVAITIWHKDPCKNGDEDSCGYCFPNLTMRHIERCKNLAFFEGDNPWWRKLDDKEMSNPVVAESFVRAGLLLVSDRVIGKPISWEKACVWAAELVHGDDHVRGLLAFLPGYHTNSTDEKHIVEDRRNAGAQLFICLTRQVLWRTRPWYKHPKWHIWHWRIRVHVLQSLKRWMFTRCCICGKRFKWDESVLSRSWDSPGPKWFKSEEGLCHFSCDKSAVPSKGTK